jgi:PKD repeat protein
MMKNYLVVLLVLFPLSGLMAQTTDCTVKIIYSMNKTMPPSYTFKIDPQVEGARYYWTFGDSTISDSPTPIHSFRITDSYLIKVKVTDKTGKICYGEIKERFEGANVTTSTILAGKGKVKNLNSNLCGFVILLENGTTLIPAKMTTDFQLKDGQYIEFTYEKLATKVSTCNEGIDVKILTIKEIPVTPDCKAYFTFVKEAGTGKKFTFNNLSTGDLAESNWSFGDSAKSKEFKPVHEYAAAGVYRVCLSTLTKTGCKSEYCAEIKVEIQPVVASCKFDIVLKPKEATPNAFLFSTVSTVEILTWKWNFGDSKTSELKNPEHFYEKPGVYEVSCIIKTASGCTETRSLKLSVLAAALDNCSGAINILLYDPTNNLCNGKATVTLKDNTGKDITLNVTYIWSDNRTGSTVENLCPDKVYTVQAIVDGVCQKSYSFAFLSKPIWRATTSNGQNKFAVISPVEGVQYEWDFGNGVIMKGAEVNYNFENDGVYNVKLTAISGSNFSDYTQQVVISKSITSIKTINNPEPEIYPNPVREMLNINFGNPVQVKMLIEIMDINGQKVYNQQFNAEGFSQASINVDQLKAGIYFFRISSGEKLLANKKFIKAD